ncbi:MAG: hypothetical protein OJF48_003225 [Afipia sp.]|nr:MAG: hypothetical protein OJF48_003225 [Afipia sp.]
MTLSPADDRHAESTKFIDVEGRLIAFFILFQQSLKYLLRLR